MHWTLNTVDARVSALPVCHHQGILMLTQTASLNWSNVWNTDAQQFQLKQSFTSKNVVNKKPYIESTLRSIYAVLRGQKIFTPGGGLGCRRPEPQLITQIGAESWRMTNVHSERNAKTCRKETEYRSCLIFSAWINGCIGLNLISYTVHTILIVQNLKFVYCDSKTVAMKEAQTSTTATLRDTCCVAICSHWSFQLLSI